MKARAYLNAKRGPDRLVDVEVLGMPREVAIAVLRASHHTATLRTTLVLVVGETTPRPIATERLVMGDA